MNAKAALVERLSTDAGVIACGNTGVRPVQGAEDDSFPLVVFERTSTDRPLTLAGDPMPAATTFALYCFATTDAAASALGDAVRASLLDPAWTRSSDGSLLVLSVTAADESDGSEPPLHAQEFAVYRVDLSFTITHTP